MKQSFISKHRWEFIRFFISATSLWFESIDYCYRSDWAFVFTFLSAMEIFLLNLLVFFFSVSFSSLNLTSIHTIKTHISMLSEFVLEIYCSHEFAYIDKTKTMCRKKPADDYLSTPCTWLSCHCLFILMWRKKKFHLISIFSILHAKSFAWIAIAREYHWIHCDWEHQFKAHGLLNFVFFLLGVYFIFSIQIPKALIINLKSSSLIWFFLFSLRWAFISNQHLMSFRCVEMFNWKHEAIKC